MSNDRAYLMLAALGVAFLLVLSACGGGSVVSDGGPTDTAGTVATPSGGLAPAAAWAAWQGADEDRLPVKGQPPDREHGLARGDRFTMQPGATAEKHGWLRYSCPPGGPACVCVVGADGTLFYERGGGVPFIAVPVPLPGVYSNHGLARGAAFTIQPGVTRRLGNVEFSCPAGGAACNLSVTPGRLVNYDPAGGIPSVAYIPREPFKEVHATFIPTGPDEDGTHRRFPPGVKYWLYEDVDPVGDRAPVMAFDRVLHVGADVAPPAGALGDAGRRGGVALSKGEVRDGEGAAEVLDYLRTMASGNIAEHNVAGLQRWNGPPTVRIVGQETDGRYIRLTRDAARIVNAALPFTRRLRLQSIDRLLPEEGVEECYDTGLGNFFVRFVPKSSPWWSGDDGNALGRARALQRVVYSERRQRWEVGRGEGVLRADVVIDPDMVSYLSDAEATHLLVHEFLHAMGFTSHTDAERFTSTLNERWVRGRAPRSLIHPIDREGLLAAYSRFEAGALAEEMTPESLGPWTDTSFHLRGDFGLPSGDVAFGVAFRNGLGQPWASGPVPATTLADNAALSGSATWSGGLIGVTPDGDAVSGDSALTVDLSKVRTPAYLSEPDGTLSFTDIRFDDGASWGDGDLRYAIEVSGRQFHRAGSSFVPYADGLEAPHNRASGEDFGGVTGVFFGAGHEGMGGVLERHDLSAAFGGKRVTGQ